MNKKLVISICLILLNCWFLLLPKATNARRWPENLPTISVKVTPPEKAAIMFIDPEHTQASRQFSSGQMIYVFLQATGSGGQEKSLRVLDASKNQIQLVLLQQAGNGPYSYQAALPAPENAGLYYLDIKIKSEGFSLAHQENFNVGEGQTLSSVSSKVENVVVEEKLPAAGEADVSPALTAVSTTVPTESKTEAEEPMTFIARLMAFLRRLFRPFKFLTRGGK